MHIKYFRSSFKLKLQSTTLHPCPVLSGHYDNQKYIWMSLWRLTDFILKCRAWNSWPWATQVGSGSTCWMLLLYFYGWMIFWPWPDRDSAWQLSILTMSQACKQPPLNTCNKGLSTGVEFATSSQLKVKFEFRKKLIHQRLLYLFCPSPCLSLQFWCFLFTPTGQGRWLLCWNSCWFVG